MVKTMTDLGVIQPQTVAPHRSKSFQITSHPCSIKIYFFFNLDPSFEQAKNYGNYSEQQKPEQ